MCNKSFLPFLIAIYVTALILRPILAFKIVSIAGISFPGALLLFPLSFVCNDIFSEVYGYEKSRSIIWSGLLAQLLTTVVITIVIIVPSNPAWKYQNEFHTVLGLNWRIAFASLLGCFLGEVTNSIVISKMKFSQNGKTGLAQANRFIVSTIFGELVDSLVFISLAFFGVYSGEKIIKLILTTWVLKTIYEIILIPISTSISQYIKKMENLDIIDSPRITDYRIFKL